MSKEKASSHFLGRQGFKKLNCAQTIINAFKDKFLLTEDLVARFEGYGGGKAPGGHCGAYYAARVILEKSAPEKLKDLEKTFITHANSTKCKEIRSCRSLTCTGCVEKAAESLEDI